MSMIYVIATPLGNMGDFSKRAQETLLSADIIACEDTRVARKLLSIIRPENHNSKKQRILCHAQQNEKNTAEYIIAELLKSESTLALISDAGTPCVSDPGYRLIKLAYESGIEVRTVPGPCAYIALASISGLATNRIYFCGFLPRKKSAFNAELSQWRLMKGLIAFYESPHRIIQSLDQIETEFPNATICVGRELTKMHEEVIRGPITDVSKNLKSRQIILGELVCLLDVTSDGDTAFQNDTEKKTSTDLIKKIKLGLRQNESAKDLATRLSKEFNLKRKDVYNQIIEMKVTPDA